LSGQRKCHRTATPSPGQDLCILGQIGRAFSLKSATPGGRRGEAGHWDELMVDHHYLGSWGSQTTDAGLPHHHQGQWAEAQIGEPHPLSHQRWVTGIGRGISHTLPRPNCRLAVTGHRQSTTRARPAQIAFQLPPPFHGPLAMLDVPTSTRTQPLAASPKVTLL